MYINLGNVEAIKDLIKNGVDVNFVLHDQTPMYAASKNGKGNFVVVFRGTATLT